VIAAVTGASGFIGSHVTRLLVERGERVRALMRPGRIAASLSGLPIHTVEGDVRDQGSLRRFVDGADLVIHCAAVYDLDVPFTRDVIETNVGGTNNLLAACRNAGVGRIVHVSTMGTLAAPDGGVGDESMVIAPGARMSTYISTKLLAEQAALEAAAAGLPVVVVNPAAPLGPGDVTPSVTGRRVVQFLRGRLPDYVRGRMAHVGVRDAALGILLAGKSGRIGERYLLAHENLGYEAFLDLLERGSGRPRPRRRLIDRWILRRPHFARLSLAFSGDKARRELGLVTHDLLDAVREEAAWFRENGYA
jgi:dihydroflavonol-4-reductase